MAAGFFNKDPHVIRWLKRLVDGIARLLIRLRFTPMVLTMLGLLLGLTGAVLVGQGHFTAAFFILLAALVADATDGAVARAKGSEGEAGAFLDSVLDRYVDIAIFLGIAWYYIKDGQDLLALVAFAGLVGAVVTSYAAARASSLGVSRYVGPLARLHRAVLMMIGIALPFTLPVVLWLLAILGNWTAINRIRVYSRMLQTPPPLEAAPVESPLEEPIASP